jgi:prepilin-type N-terminal cleavage/methylation domain-containing protein
MPRPKAQSTDGPEGFSLLEMMMVVTVILIVASIATPIYQTCPSADGRGRASRSPLHPARLD